jgi:hypothetical protein
MLGMAGTLCAGIAQDLAVCAPTDGWPVRHPCAPDVSHVQRDEGHPSPLRGAGEPVPQMRRKGVGVITTESNREYKDRTLILAVIGAGLLLVGAVAACYAPAELYCFPLFSAGGRFHYEGFGFGSVMFAVIAWQVVAYAAIALVLIPLGYGHLRVRRWARLWMLSLLWSAWIVGLPLIVVFLFLLSVKDLPSTAAWLVLVTLGVSYLVGPGLLIRFYSSHDVRRTFEGKDAQSYRIESLPMPVLVLVVLFIFYASVMNVPLFFQGLFPLFGVWLSGIPGVLALAVSIVSLAGLAWGVWRQRMWAWWGALGYFVLLPLSGVVTLLRSSWAEILSLLRLPPMEVEMLQGVPLQGAHLAPFVGIPLVLTLGVIVRWKRHF